MPHYPPSIELHEVPRSNFERLISEAAKTLQPDDPGYAGQCRLFRQGNLNNPWPLVCRGSCETFPGEKCRIVRIVATEGTHSDLYHVIVTCVCGKDLLEKAPTPPRKKLKTGTIVIE